MAKPIRLLQGIALLGGFFLNTFVSLALTNPQIEEFILAHYYSCTSPTIRAFIDSVMINPRVEIVNIKGSYGTQIARDHAACEAVDISKRLLPDPQGAKDWFETFGVVCESHYNNSARIAPVKNRQSHFHCYNPTFHLQARR